MKLSGAIAKVFMVWWCRSFREALVAATINIPRFLLYLHLFYVDDHNLALEELPPGARYREGKVVVVPEEVEGDLLLPGDQRTALVVQEIANTVCEFTSFKADFPSAHSSGWMPLLDLQVRVEEDNSISWKFYRKEVSSPFTILNHSALPGKVKRVSLVQEGLRRLRNTRPSLVPVLQKELMESLAEMMLISGYPEEFRAGVIQSAVIGYQRLAAACERGERPLYRPRTWQQETRRRMKTLKKAAWHRPADTVLFVPATPDAELAERVRKVLEEEGPRLGMSIRVVETGGLSLKRQLVRTDVAAGKPCRQEDCPPCLSGQRGGLLHQRSGALYRGSCLLCPEQDKGTAVYTGETGYSGYTRLCQHTEEIRAKDQSNAFSKHLREEHPEREGDPETFNFEVI